ncbi:hypothetical protein [Streptomyces hilarionis]|uniref:hypothetical protein n=1 Tax=Streptomyces hilarionis TaxID=2839954 RepID=UPI002795408E|nr:hypothetical protein [Streptomyces hilarionis]
MRSAGPSSDQYAAIAGAFIHSVISGRSADRTGRSRNSPAAVVSVQGRAGWITGRDRVGQSDVHRLGRHRADDDTIGRHLETGLRGNGYTPTWSRTVSPLRPRPRAPYDVLLLDLGLPGIDGLDVARARHPDLLIVILTARTDDIDVIAGRGGPTIISSSPSA